MNERPAIRVTVYVVSTNYGEYLREAVESVFSQTLTSWEVLIYDNASTDETAAVAADLAAQYPDAVRVIRTEKVERLQRVANLAIAEARGEYLVRLDADDFFDENALLVMAGYLDRDKALALVYPGYVYIDAAGRYIGVEQRRLDTPGMLRDQPAHGACTLVRTSVIREVGGYDESNDRQDGYELWLKVSRHYPVKSIPTPLFYYRQHPHSLSRDKTVLLEARARIKRDTAAANGLDANLGHAIAIVPVKNTYRHLPNVALGEIAGRPLLDYTIEAAFETELFEKVVVTTDDPAVVKYCEEQYPDVYAYLRSEHLSEIGVVERTILKDAIEKVEAIDGGKRFDTVVSLSVHTPLRRAVHIRNAVDTLLLFDSDVVLSVCEDRELYFVIGDRGLKPLNHAMHRQVRVERETLLVSNGAVRAMWRHVLDADNDEAAQTGHFIMPRWESIQIKTSSEAWLAEKVMKSKKLNDKLVTDAQRKN